MVKYYIPEALLLVIDENPEYTFLNLEFPQQCYPKLVADVAKVSVSLLNIEQFSVNQDLAISKCLLIRNSS
jgi:hypothetical protein